MDEERERDVSMTMDEWMCQCNPACKINTNDCHHCNWRNAVRRGGGGGGGSTDAAGVANGGGDIVYT